MSVESSDKRYFEDILDKIGWGIYHKFVIGFTSVIILINSIATIGIHFALPFSSCNSLLIKEEIMLINILFILENFYKDRQIWWFIGQAIGGFFLSCLSDNCAKNQFIGKTLIITFASCFTIAFSYNSYTMYLAAFLLGSSIQVNLIITNIYLCEILPKKKRGFYMVLPQLFLCLGYFIILIFSYFVINDDVVQHDGIDIRLTSWRGLFATVGGLSLVLACVSALLEFSPRYLLFKKRITSTLLILKQFYAINESKYSENCDIQAQQLYGLIDDYGINNNRLPDTLLSYIVRFVKVMCRRIALCFSNKNRKLLICLSLIYAAVLFRTLNFVILLAKILNYHENQTDIDLIEILHINPINKKNCSEFNDEIQIYENFFLLSIHIVFGLVLLLFVIDSIGRKIPICSGLFLCGICSLLLAYIKNFIITIILSSIFIFCHTTVEVTLRLINIESFPTAIRGTATGLTPNLAFLISIVLYVFPKIPQLLFFVVSGIGFIGASIIACFLDELKNEPMIE